MSLRSSFLPPQDLSKLSISEIEQYETEIDQKLKDLENEKAFRVVENRINRHYSYISSLLNNAHTNQRMNLEVILKLIKTIGASVVNKNRRLNFSKQRMEIKMSPRNIVSLASMVRTAGIAVTKKEGVVVAKKEGVAMAKKEGVAMAKKEGKREGKKETTTMAGIYRPKEEGKRGKKEGKKLMSPEEIRKELKKMAYNLLSSDLHTIYGYCSIDAFAREWFFSPDMIDMASNSCLGISAIANIITRYLLPSAELLLNNAIVTFSFSAWNGEWNLDFQDDNGNVEEDWIAKISPQILFVKYVPFRCSNNYDPRWSGRKLYCSQSYLQLISLCDFLGLQNLLREDIKIEDVKIKENGAIEEKEKEINWSHLALIAYCFMSPLVNELLPEWAEKYCDEIIARDLNRNILQREESTIIKREQPKGEGKRQSKKESNFKIIDAVPGEI